MKADIIRVASEMDFDQNATANFLYLRLPSGRVVRGLIDDDAMKAIVEDRVRSGNAPQPVMTATAPQPAQPSFDHDPGEGGAPMDLPEYTGPDGVPVGVFGGTGDVGEPVGYNEPDPPVPTPAHPSLRRPQPPPQRKIQADESGNPIGATAGGVNPDERIADGFNGRMTAG